LRARRARFFFVFTYILCGYYLKKNDEVKNPIFLKNRIFFELLEIRFFKKIGFLIIGRDVIYYFKAIALVGVEVSFVLVGFLQCAVV
jgi:ribosomal protein S18 acetylase RimI-like enzyme